MFKTLKSKLVSYSSAIIMAVALIAPALTFSTVSAQTNIQNNVCTGANNLQISTNTGASNCASDNTATNSINHLLTTVINIFSIVVGIIAVIMIIVGGLRYIISGGESASVSGAKNTILFAIVGLIIVALAQIIVRFVLGKATQSTSSNGGFIYLPHLF